MGFNLILITFLYKLVTTFFFGFDYRKDQTNRKREKLGKGKEYNAAAVFQVTSRALILTGFYCACVSLAFHHLSPPRMYERFIRMHSLNVKATQPVSV